MNQSKTDSDCVFCRIVAGKLPAARVYEDADTLAFLDIGPVGKGHTLVIPKGHFDPITHTPPDVLQKVIVIVQKVARALFQGLKADAINVTQANGELAGQIIPHIHFHIIPRYQGDRPLRNWVPGKYDSPDEMTTYAERIRKALEQPEAS